MAIGYYTTCSIGDFTSLPITWNTSGTTTSIQSPIYYPVISDRLPAEERTYKLPDGSKLLMDKNGNYQIEDKDAKVTYQANNIRAFSPYLNASDLLAQFVRYVGSLGGIEAKEILGLPIELFINWLVIEAAERDKDPVPEDIKPIKQHKALKGLMKPKCLSCGRFIPLVNRKNNFAFCNVDHGVKYLERYKPVLLALPRPVV